MEEIKNFVINNQGVIISLGVLVISEFMALYPKSKANGILHLIINILAKKKQ